MYAGAGINLLKPHCCTTILNTLAKMDIITILLNYLCD